MKWDTNTVKIVINIEIYIVFKSILKIPYQQIY